MTDAERIAELEAERDAAFALSKCECGADEACRNLVAARKRAEAAESSLAALKAEVVEVVGPFADFANAYFHKYETRPGVYREAHSDKPNDTSVYGFNSAILTIGHLRAARALITKIGG